MGAFKGFGAKALPFFKGLAFHQDKVWFDENRALYDKDVVIPFTALLDDLTERFATAKIPLRADGKKAIFRIHRDVRFARDKSPYKTHAGAVMTRSGAKNDPGLLYVHVSPEGCFVAAGFHMPEPPQLAKFRDAIRRKPAAFEKMLGALTAGGLEISSADQLSRVPRGFEDIKGTTLEGVIRLKSFIVEEKLSAAAIAKPALTGTIADFGKRALPLLEFGWGALG